MAKVKFTGRDDLRILDAADLKKAGVEGFKKTEFPRFEAVEVPDEVADALLDEPDLFGSFEEVEDEERDAPVETKAAAKDSKPAKSGAASNSPSTPSAGGNGSSTGA